MAEYGLLVMVIMVVDAYLVPVFSPPFPVIQL